MTDELLSTAPASRVEDILPDEDASLVTYFTKKIDYTLTLRPARKTNVNGFEEVIPGYTARFRDHYFKTRDKVMIQALDKLLSGSRSRHFRKRFSKVPSKDQMAKYSKKAEDIKKAKDAIDKKFGVTPADVEVKTFKAAEKVAKDSKTKYAS